MFSGNSSSLLSFYVCYKQTPEPQNHMVKRSFSKIFKRSFLRLFCLKCDHTDAVGSVLLLFTCSMSVIGKVGPLVIVKIGIATRVRFWFLHVSESCSLL